MSSITNNSNCSSEPSCTKELHAKMCKKIADLTRVIDKLFRQFYEQTSSFDALQLKVKHVSVKNEKLEKEKAKALSELESCREEVKELRKVNSHLTEEVGELRNQLAVCQRERDDSLAKTTIIKKSLQDVEGDLDQLQLTYDKLVESTEQKNCDTVADHTELINSLQRQLDEQSIKFAKLSDQKELLQINYKELKNQHNTAIEDCRQLRQQLETNEETIESLNSEKCSLQLQIAQLLKELQELRCSVKQGVKKMMVSNAKQKTVPVIKQKREYWLQHSPKVNTSCVH